MPLVLNDRMREDLADDQGSASYLKYYLAVGCGGVIIVTGVTLGLIYGLSGSDGDLGGNETDTSGGV